MFTKQAQKAIEAGKSYATIRTDSAKKAILTGKVEKVTVSCLDNYFKSEELEISNAAGFVANTIKKGVSCTINSNNPNTLHIRIHSNLYYDVHFATEEVETIAEVTTQTVASKEIQTDETTSTPVTKIPVESIEFVWSESSAVKNNTIIKTFAEANIIASRISSDAHSEGGYRKTQIKITFTDGNTYSFRYDIQYNDHYNCDVTKRVTKALECYAGLEKPANMSDAQYKAMLKLYKSEEQSLHILNTYSFEDAAQSPEPTKQTEQNIIDTVIESPVTNEVIEEESTEAQEVAIIEPSQDAEVDEITATNNNQISVKLNEDKNGVEIYFSTKPEQHILDQLNKLKFRWHRVNKYWYAKQSDDTLSFANSLTSTDEPLEASQASSDPIEYEDININDIDSYTIYKSLQDREHDSAFTFRINKIDRTKEIQDTFTHYNQMVIDALANTNNERIIYYLKKALQSFKKRYYNNYITLLNHKASNPSWAVTGRGNLNVSRYNKAMNRQDKLMQESAELISQFNKKLSRAKREIKQEKEQLLKDAMSNVTLDITFKTVNKVTEDNKRVRMYQYDNYTIVKHWGTYRIFKSAKEIHSMKTTQTLSDAKRYVCMLVQNDNENIAG